ncbi:MAG: cyclase family protein [Betaproteobacteria bacterium]|nr:cyclase family protein [Betaproteobacteria bacterium]
MTATASRRSLLPALLLTAFSAVTTAAFGQGWAPPAADKRCPSKWGAADQRGSANLMTPETVMRATRLIKEGKVFELGKVLEPAIPKFGLRQYSILTQRSAGPGGRNQQTGNEEVVITELGQVGTQFDALAHIGIGEDLYNCNKTMAIATRNGFTKLGVENVGALMTRGVMLDVAALKGQDILPAGYEITVADLEAAIQKQGTQVGKADVVLVRTGWGRHYVTNNPTFNSGQPGIGVGAAEWLAAKDIMLVGSDNWGIEVFPNPDKELRFPVHQIMLTVNGIYQIENLDLEGLSKEKAYEFAFVVQPLKIKGGTGSTVAPIAIR